MSYFFRLLSLIAAGSMLFATEDKSSCLVRIHFKKSNEGKGAETVAKPNRNTQYQSSFSIEEKKKGEWKKNGLENFRKELWEKEQIKKLMQLPEINFQQEGDLELYIYDNKNDRLKKLDNESLTELLNKNTKFSIYVMIKRKKESNANEGNPYSTETQPEDGNEDSSQSKGVLTGQGVTNKGEDLPDGIQNEQNEGGWKLFAFKKGGWGITLLVIGLGIALIYYFIPKKSNNQNQQEGLEEEDEEDEELEEEES